MADTTGIALDISSLIPKREKIRFENGEVRELLSRVELDAEAMGRLEALNKEVQTLSQDLGDDGSVGKTKELEKLLGEIMRIFIVDLDDETLATVPFGLRAEILPWWTERNRKGRADNEVKKKSGK